MRIHTAAMHANTTSTPDTVMAMANGDRWESGTHLQSHTTTRESVVLIVSALMLCMGTNTCCSGAASGTSQLVTGLGQAVSAAVCRHASGRKVGLSCRQERRGWKEGTNLVRLLPSSYHADKPPEHALDCCSGELKDQ